MATAIIGKQDRINARERLWARRGLCGGLRETVDGLHGAFRRKVERMRRYAEYVGADL